MFLLLTMCAAGVTTFLLLTVCAAGVTTFLLLTMCAAGVTTFLLLTLCSRCVHVLTTGEGLIIQKNDRTEEGLMNVFATNVFGHYVLVSFFV